jgi:hypothetical protein
MPAPAEEKGFEPLVPLPVRRFSNSGSPDAGGCTSTKAREIERAATNTPARNGTERHRDQERDQVRDQVTNSGDLVALASAVLDAVAAGRTESLDLALQLAETVLDVPLIRRATVLRDLLKERSPFALVRAVELAEGVLGGPGHLAASPKTRP